MKGSARYVIRTLPALLCSAMTGVKVINGCISNVYTTLFHILVKQDHHPLLHHILLLHMRRSLPVYNSSAVVFKFKGALQGKSKTLPIVNQPELCLDSLFRRICILTKSACYIRHVRLSVILHVSARLPLERFSCNLIMGGLIWIFWYFAGRASQYIYLNIDQLDALNFIMSLFHASTCFEHMCSSSGGQNCTIQPLVSSHL
jgi:hypothetical protein